MFFGMIAGWESIEGDSHDVQHTAFAYADVRIMLQKNRENFPSTLFIDVFQHFDVILIDLKHKITYNFFAYPKYKISSRGDSCKKKWL